MYHRSCFAVGAVLSSVVYAAFLVAVAPVLAFTKLVDAIAPDPSIAWRMGAFYAAVAACVSYSVYAAAWK